MNKLNLIFAVVLSATAAITAKRTKVLWIEQKLDNFNSSEIRIWRMRYMANDKFFQCGGPLFVNVGGEWSISPIAIDKDHQIYHMAREHHGYLFHTEHRFYGKSQPFDAISDEYFKYLNAQQALADLANFIRTVKETFHCMEKSKVILIGCSYGGSLATWFKKLYPDLATAVWASSAPLLAKADFAEAKILTAQSIKEVGGDACYNRIKNGFADLESLLDHNRGDEVQSMLKLCGPFNEDNNLDVSTLFYQISEMFVNLVYQRQPYQIQIACYKIMKSYFDVFGLANYLANNMSGSKCTKLSYNSLLNYFKNSTFAKSLLLPWTYQRCNEFGWFETSSSTNQSFGSKLPLDFFATLCADLYGDKFTEQYIEERVNATNNRFGGLSPNLTNIYWTNGGLDPYTVLGMQNGTQATVIPDLAHCGDLRVIVPSDSLQLKASKEKVQSLVREWLAE